MTVQLAKVAFAPDISCNVTDQMIMDQVALNIRRGLPQVKQYAPNSEIIALVCGGPSLKDTEQELIDVVWRGAKIVAVNGSYQWCIDRNLKPSVAVVLDAREFNSRFVRTPVPGCKYLLASQCHSATFDLCADRETYIWHAVSGGDPELEMLKQYYFGKVSSVAGGTTVATRAIWLMRMLGFQLFEVFGLDSCVFGNEHHAYPQPENDVDKLYNVFLRAKGKSDKVMGPFVSSPWMMKQFNDILHMIKNRGDFFRLNVHGSGLIAAAMRMGFEIDVETSEPRGD